LIDPDKDPAMKIPTARNVITRKRKKLAKLIASGQTLQRAYEGAYNVKDVGSPNAHRTNGHQISKIPEVAQLIKDFEEEIMPLGDLRQEQEQALSHLKALAFNALDEKTRVSATVHLYHLLEVHRQTEERIKAKRAAASVPIPVEAVVNELLQLAQRSPMELEEISPEGLGTTEESSEDSAQDPEGTE
jgi:hypothetical protein